MSYAIVKLPAMQIIGLTNETTNENNKCVSDVPKFWKEYFADNIETTIPNKKEPLKRICLYTDYNPHGYAVIIGACVTSLQRAPENLVAREIPAGEYAVFTMKGPVETSAAKEWKHILAIADLPRAYTYDFELYEYEGEELRDQKIFVSLK